MTFEIVLTSEAEYDLDRICDYIAEHDSIENVDRVLNGLEATWTPLCDFPERGNIPKELSRLGIRDYREAHWKPYRLIYRVHG